VALGAGREPRTGIEAYLDLWAIADSDRRKHRSETIASLAAQEGLLGLPGTAFPALLEVERVVSRTASP
jgi:hypothetical protein